MTSGSSMGRCGSGEGRGGGSGLSCITFDRARGMQSTLSEPHTAVLP